MNNVRTLICLSIMSVQATFAQESATYQYVFPKPNSQYVSRESNVILRPGRKIDRSSVVLSLIRVEGSRSGVHHGVLMLSDDEQTIVFNPFEPFAEQERVMVHVGGGLRATDGTPMHAIQFEYTTAVSASAPPNPLPVSLFDIRQEREFPGSHGMTQLGDTLPSDFPIIRVDSVNDPAPGEIFLANFPIQGGSDPNVQFPYANYLMVLDNGGKPLSYKRIGALINPFAYMFKVEANGLFSYIERNPTSTAVKIVDSSFKLIDTYPKGNPSITSHSDFLLLPNGHALVLYFDNKIIDMSKVVQGGHPAATVTGTLVQEFDLKKNVVFQWSSFDYQAITDTYEDTLAASFRYSHANGIELDRDGNILLSNRHMSEITKIDRNTGEIMWRLGGKRNQFAFVNEHPANGSLFFSYQHHIQRLPNGHITFFDNGNQRTPQFSRAVEYQLDEVNKTATLIWEYRHTPDIYASAQGSVQRQPNGNTLIGWGDAGLFGLPTITEVHPDNSIALELSLPKAYRSMRVYRFPWKTGQPTGSRTIYELLQGNTYSFNDTTGTGRTGVRLKCNILSGIFYNSMSVQKFGSAPLKPEFVGRAPWMASQRVTVSQFGIATIDADMFFDASQLTGIPEPNKVTVYQRDTIGSGVFTALPTTYNSVKNEIVSNTSRFGEFVFCWNDSDSSAHAPMMLYPADGDSVNRLLPVSFRWNPRGYTTGYHLQVATDSLFESLVLNDSLLTVTSDTMATVFPNVRYYWRIQARNHAQIANWSQARSFTATMPYVFVSVPGVNEVWQRGDEYFIRWSTNIRDRVRIELLQDMSRLIVIKDSVSNVGAFAWTIPSTIGPGSTYKIKVTSVADNSLFGISSGNVTIDSGPTEIEERSHSPQKFALYQNYPNPFNPSTTIRYDLPKSGTVSLKVFNALGQLVAILVNGFKEAGSHQAEWKASVPSGVYFYRIQSGEYLNNKRMIVLR